MQRSMIRRAVAAVLLAVGIGVFAGTTQASAAATPTTSAAGTTGSYSVRMQPSDWWW